MQNALNKTFKSGVLSIVPMGRLEFSGLVLKFKPALQCADLCGLLLSGFEVIASCRGYECGISRIEVWDMP